MKMKKTHIDMYIGKWELRSLTQEPQTPRCFANKKPQIMTPTPQKFTFRTKMKLSKHRELYIQYPGLNHNRKEYLKECIYMYN